MVLPDPETPVMIMTIALIIGSGSYRLFYHGCLRPCFSVQGEQDNSLATRKRQVLAGACD